jgi:hypothetical protein
MANRKIVMGGNKQVFNAKFHVISLRFQATKDHKDDWELGNSGQKAVAIFMNLNLDIIHGGAAAEEIVDSITPESKRPHR